MYRGNPLRPLVDEAATMVGLNIKIDTIFNMWGEITHIFNGKPQTTFAVGVAVAEKHYLSPRALEKAIVIANTYAKASEPHSGITTAIPSVSRNGGDLVLICNAPEGQVVHFLFGAFGRMGRKFQLPNHINRLIIFSEYPYANLSSAFAPIEKVTQVSKWDKVLEILNNADYRRRNVPVAVYPNAEIQYCNPSAI